MRLLFHKLGCDYLLGNNIFDVSIGSCEFFRILGINKLDTLNLKYRAGFDISISGGNITVFLRFYGEDENGFLADRRATSRQRYVIGYV